MHLSNAQLAALDNYKFTERELTRHERDGFHVVVRAEPEAIIPLEEYSRDEPAFAKDLLQGNGEFFSLWAYVYFEDIMFGTAQMGGCAYQDPQETLSNGVAEELISEAMTEAKDCVARLIRQFGTVSSAPRTGTPRRRRRVCNQSAGVETNSTCTPTACGN